MLRAAAEGLQGANVTVLDGAEGLNSVVASLAGQGMTMLETLRSGPAAPARHRRAPLNGKPADRVGLTPFAAGRPTGPARPVRMIFPGRVARVGRIRPVAILGIGPDQEE